MYVGLFPCNECAKVIIQCGIKQVVYLSDKYHGKEKWVASRRMLDLSGVQYRQYIPFPKTLTIDFSSSDESVYDTAL